MRDKNHNALDTISNNNDALSDIRPDLLIHNIAGYKKYFIDPIGPELAETREKVTIKTDCIDIDQYLGCYIPSQAKILIYSENIITSARLIDCTAADLTRIVEYHEYAHAIIHLASSEDERIKALEDKAYIVEGLSHLTQGIQAISESVHEKLAQLITYHAILRLSRDTQNEITKKFAGNLMDSFEKLEKRQSERYQITHLKSVPLERIQLSIKLMKDGALRGDLQTWERVMLCK